MMLSGDMPKCVVESQKNRLANNASYLFRSHAIIKEIEFNIHLLNLPIFDKLYLSMPASLDNGSGADGMRCFWHIAVRRG